MQEDLQVTSECTTVAYATSQSVSLEVLCELGRATTAYHEAPPERVENARQEYEEALRKFNAARS